MTVFDKQETFTKMPSKKMLELWSSEAVDLDSS